MGETRKPPANRKDRLAEELRANLLKRKALTRARKQTPGDSLTGADKPQKELAESLFGDSIQPVQPDDHLMDRDSTD